MREGPTIGFRALLTWLIWVIAACALALGIWHLERERATVTHEKLKTEAGEVTIYRADATGATDGPLVIVAHGFAGSRQMMQYISRDLARAGFVVAAYDFYGHGRDGRHLSPDVTRIEGTTQQLVNQTKAIVRAVQADLRTSGPIALVGHSMATDIVIRAADELPAVAAIVAISMYSDAITPTFPERLLVLSGAMEHRLRAVGREVVAQLDATASEGETVRAGDVQRRTVSVPNTEHVAVLFSPVTIEETRAWIAGAFSRNASDGAPRSGPAILVVLFAIVVLIWPVSRVFNGASKPPAPLSYKQFFFVLAAPVVPAFLATSLGGGSLLGTAAFGSLLVFFLIWGLVALCALWWCGRRPEMPNLAAAAFLVFWALAIFGLALDRYAAAFVPTGPRLPLTFCLLLGTLPFALADRLLVASAPLWQRGIARLLPIVILAACMILNPENMGVSFTVLPVMVLFYTVYGTMARAVARRTSPETAALALGGILAWSVASSTPLFTG
ncbi:MAG: alpha/beta hydrolase [Roseobacter sp.]